MFSASTAIAYPGELLIHGKFGVGHMIRADTALPRNLPDVWRSRAIAWTRIPVQTMVAVLLDVPCYELVVGGWEATATPL